MVNLPPPESDDQRSVNPLRDNDEAIAVVIALLSIGTVLWWGLSRGRELLSPAVSLPQLTDPAAEDQPLFDLDSTDEDNGLSDSRTPVFPFTRDSSERDDEESRLMREDNGIGGSLPGLVPRRERDVETTPENSSDASDTLGVGAIETPTTAPITAEPDAADVAVPSDSEEETAATTTPPPLDISDVSEDYWAYPYIVSLYDQGLLPDLPSGQLQPDAELTRAEFAALLNSSFVNEEPPERDLAFTDITDNYWAADAIDQVVRAGYMTGFPDGTFQPDAVVPRYQVLITLATGLDLQFPSDVQSVLDGFQGAQELPEWSRPQVAAAAAENIVVNHPEPQQLEPQQPATRAEIIAMIHQALESQGRVEAVETPYVFTGE